VIGRATTACDHEEATMTVMEAGRGCAAAVILGTGQLSGREREILRLVAAGHTDREIAEALYLSRHTAANHVRHILAKLGAPTRAAAVARAVLADLL
jgi:DNA-binding CsgD family transcriptional regulator